MPDGNDKRQSKLNSLFSFFTITTMKKELKYILSLAVSAMAVLSTACTPDDHELANAPISPDDLVEGIAFTVTPDANDPNTIHLTSLVKGGTPVWNTPQGRSQSEDWTIQLPFAGEYTIEYGVMTQAGTIWGEPYTLTLESNNFALCSDQIWTDLAGGVDENGNGNPKKWYPVDKVYASGWPVGPVSYMDPGSYPTPEFRNWAYNWDPGFQSWLIPEGDPYLESYMILGLDSQKGCVVEEYRKSADGEEHMNGSFVLNISDPKHPSITFTGGTFALHNVGMDATCSNYTNDIVILECNEYLLQVATMRTNSEGPWWLIWNYVSEAVKNDPSILPTDGPGLLEGTPVQEPAYDDLATAMFTISGADASYVSTKTTYLLNEETPYDLLWWNPASAKWEWINGYGSTWAPEYTAIDEFALTLENNGNATLESAETPADAHFTIEGNKIVFDKEITLLSTGDVAVKGTEFTVMKCSADDNEVVFGIPVEYDAAGAANKYLCARMTIKPIGGGQTGPVEIKVDSSKIAIYLEADKYLRLQFYNPYTSEPEGGWPIDPTKLKLKKGQKLVLKYTVSGVNWTGTPRAAFCCNIDGFEWEPNCFDNFQGQDFNTSGENVMELVNNTGSTYNFDGVGSLQVSIQFAGFTDSSYEDAVVNVTSLTIE